MTIPHKKISSFKNLDDFKTYVESLCIDLPIDSELIGNIDSPLASNFKLPGGRVIGNRFCIHPMEGWDGTTDGNPTELTYRRWKKFGISGAKLIWGGEATAVRPDGRANPNQLMIVDDTKRELEKLRLALVESHQQHIGNTDDLLVGLQLTHSGRFCRPNAKGKLEPKILYHHPMLDEMFNISPNHPVLTDMEIDDLVRDFIYATKCAEDIGFEFVDIKHCHGYLGHEFLSAVERPGNYGGSFNNRTRFLRNIVNGIKQECPGIRIGVRLSAFDFPPFRKDENNVGRMHSYIDPGGKYPFAFGGDSDNPEQIDLHETIQFIKLIKSLGVELINFTAGSPYYNPHITRPAFYPPCDGYQPPEDPLIGVARQIQVAAELKKHASGLLCVGSAYSYLQEFLPFVAQAVIRRNMVDFVGIGRMVLSYPEMPTDILAGKQLVRKKICRTFSDCTTAPRKGLVSGCYPLDHFYKERPEAAILKEFKRSK